MTLDEKRKAMIDYHLESLAMMVYIDQNNIEESEKYIYEQAPKVFSKYRDVNFLERALISMEFLTRTEEMFDLADKEEE